MSTRKGIGLAREIRSTRRSLQTLDRSLRRLAGMVAQMNGKVIGAQPQRKMSAKARASLKLQGRYMGYMRQLNLRQKAQVRKIKDTEGVRAAIVRARVLRAGRL